MLKNKGIFKKDKKNKDNNKKKRYIIIKIKTGYLVESYYPL